MLTPIKRTKYTFCNTKSLEHLKIFFNGPVLNLGLKLTRNVIKSQIHLVRQSLSTCVKSASCYVKNMLFSVNIPGAREGKRISWLGIHGFLHLQGQELHQQASQVEDHSEFSRKISWLWILRTIALHPYAYLCKNGEKPKYCMSAC